jgi:hypothetical protein
MDTFDANDIKSQVFIEPKTHNVTIKITGFPSNLFAKMYLSWLMETIGFEVGQGDDFIESSIN